MKKKIQTIIIQPVNHILINSIALKIIHNFHQEQQSSNKKYKVIFKKKD